MKSKLGRELQSAHWTKACEVWHCAVKAVSVSINLKQSSRKPAHAAAQPDQAALRLVLRHREHTGILKV